MSLPRAILQTLSILLVTFTASGADPVPQPQRVTFPDPRLTVDGLAWWKETNPVLKRLPDRLKATVPPKVWALSQSPAGVRIRFCTDSVVLGLEAKTGPYKVATSPALGLIGIDAYVNGRYLGSTLPQKEVSLPFEYGDSER